LNLIYIFLKQCHTFAADMNLFSNRKNKKKMKRFTMLMSLLALAAIMINTGCNKDDDDPVLPTLKLSDAAGYVSGDANAAYADTLHFGITADYNGTDNLVKFQLSLDGTILVDSTINTAQFTYDYKGVKNINDKEVWKFVVVDIAGNTTSDSVVITGGFGEINSYASITLGAQNNATLPGFVSYTGDTFTPYTIEEAFNHQADIDMFCFYENTTSHQNMMTMAAPGSGISGIFSGDYAPEFYTVQNTTYFVKTSLSASDFDVVSIDAVVLASFDPENKFRKAKVLTAGDVYAFKLQSGKFGLFKVIAVTEAEDGNLEFAVKIQK